MTPALSQRITSGARASAELTADANMLVPAFQHWFANWRDLPEVVASIVVAGLAEEACVRLLHPMLPEEATSVGAKLSMRHVAPANVGDLLRANAVVTEVRTDRVLFAIEVMSGERAIAHLDHTRVVVPRSRLQAELCR